MPRSAFAGMPFGSSPTTSHTISKSKTMDIPKTSARKPSATSPMPMAPKSRCASCGKR